MVGKLIITFALVFLLSLTVVSAFGISYQYMENNTLPLYPGQNYLFKLTIQNKDPDDMNVNVSLNSTIATLVGRSVVYIPGQTFDTFVYFNITIPRDAELGSDFAINYAVTPIDQGEGQVPLSVRYRRVINVKVVEKDPNIVETLAPVEMPKDRRPFYKTAYFTVLAIVFFVIVILLVLVVLWRKSRQLSRNIIKERPKEKKKAPETYTPKTAMEELVAARPERTTSELMAEEGHDKPSKVARENHSHWIKAEELVTSEVFSEPKRKARTGLHIFHLYQGGNLRTLEDLAQALDKMDDTVFSHHVLRSRNDFANWVLHSFNETQLAEDLSRVKTSEEMARLVKNAL